MKNRYQMGETYLNFFFKGFGQSTTFQTSAKHHVMPKFIDLYYMILRISSKNIQRDNCAIECLIRGIENRAGQPRQQIPSKSTLMPPERVASVIEAKY